MKDKSILYRFGLVVLVVIFVAIPLVIFAMRKPEWRDPDSDFEPFTWEKEKTQSQPEAQKPAAASSRS